MEPLKILLIDDDLEFGKLISRGLTSLGYKVHFQTSLAGINEAIIQFSPSIIVLDVEIGEENGIEKAKELVSTFPTIPILFVSSHADLSLVIEGISAGGVNYLTKPFDIKVLDAYIKRFAKHPQITKKIRIGNYLLDPETRRLSLGDVFPQQVAPLESNALVLLWENKNTPVSHEVLSTKLWGKSYTPDLNPSIYNIISKLRKLLNKDERVWINTVKGEGYQLIVPER